MYTVITENDVSQWDDKTGEIYHFPQRYLKYLQVGTKVLYYKGQIKDRSFQDKRLSPLPHYFGTGIIGKTYLDPKSDKHDYYAEISEFRYFDKPVIAKNNVIYLEEIPISKQYNYWRDGVREVSEKVFMNILALSGIDNNLYSDQYQGNDEALTSYLEGKKNQKYSTYYERDSRLRRAAINMHGLNCMVCGFNFQKFYGEWAQGFIHVHHIKPVAEAGERSVNPSTDLIVLCANCHAMVHRKRDTILSVEELKAKIEQKNK